MAKRLFDIVFSIIGLILFSPLFLLFAVLIKIEDGGSVFYRGERVGLEGKRFWVFKFRSMVTDAEQLGVSSTSNSDSRITQCGSLLRKYKLDELPQLINVLRGEMSLVGPRPQVAWAVALYSEKEQELLNVLPGMTDYASIRFRNEGEILRASTDPDQDYLEKIAPEKIRLGLEYVQNPSLCVDLKIIVATIWAMLGGVPDADSSVEKTRKREAV